MDKQFKHELADMKFNQTWVNYEKEKGTFDEDWAMTYALIYGNYCTSEMHSAIKEHPNFETKIRYEPLEIPIAICTLMHTPVRAICPFRTLVETLSSFFNLRQMQDEKIVDYIGRFNQAQQLAKAQLGKNFLDLL